MPGDAILASWFDRLFSAMHHREFGQDLLLNNLVGEFLVPVDRAVETSDASGAPKAFASMVAAIRKKLDASINARLSGDLAGEPRTCGARIGFPDGFCCR